MTKQIVNLLVCFFVFVGSLNAQVDQKYKIDFGGHVKERFSILFPSSESLFGSFDDDLLWASRSELRLKMRIELGEHFGLELHNETSYLKSDLKEKFSDSTSALTDPSLLDRRKFFDLSWTMNEGDSYYWQNRFDRMFVEFDVFQIQTIIGRQAHSWGDGFIFNPMDLINPFGPTVLDREYKVGEDLISLDYGTDSYDLNFIFVPRREPDKREFEFEESSIGVKYNYFIPNTSLETTFMGLYHYDDTVLGAGLVGYWNDAAWRMNVTWTDDEPDFLQFVANMDYAWTGWGKNFYAWIEYFYNGVGQTQENYPLIGEKEALIKRIERGELFVKDRHYIDTQLKVEIHPLVSIYLISITNITDPSGIIQPRLVWDLKTNLQLNLSGTFFWGAEGTEYGGVIPPESVFTDQFPNNLLIWLTWYF